MFKLLIMILKPICIPIAVYYRHIVRENRNKRWYRFLWLFLKDEVDGDIYDSRIYYKIMERDEYKFMYNKINRMYRLYCVPNRYIKDNYDNYIKANEFSIYFFILVYLDKEIKYNYEL
jgi:hypothetical protein